MRREDKRPRDGDRSAILFRTSSVMDIEPSQVPRDRVPTPDPPVDQSLDTNTTRHHDPKPLVTWTTVPGLYENSTLYLPTVPDPTWYKPGLYLPAPSDVVFENQGQKFFVPLPYRFVVDESQLSGLIVTAHSEVDGLVLTKTFYTMYDMQEGPVIRGVYVADTRLELSAGQLLCSFVFFQGVPVVPQFVPYRESTRPHVPDRKSIRKVDVMASYRGQKVLEELIAESEKVHINPPGVLPPPAPRVD